MIASPVASEFKPLSCRRAQFHFTYSFLLSSKEGGPVDPLELLNDKNTAKIRAIAGLHASGSGIADERRGPAPHLALKPDSVWFRFAEFGARIIPEIQKDSLDVTISRLLRLFPSGGTCTIAVEWKARGNSGRRLNTPELLHILNLAQRKTIARDNVKLFRRKTPDGQHLHELFIEAVTLVSRRVGLEWQEEILDVPDQYPWATTILEVEGKAAEAFCTRSDDGPDPAGTKILRIRPFEPAIAPVLYRSIAARLDLEPAYMKPPTPSGVAGLYNINIDARLYVAMSRRSILCICENAARDPASYFMPGLLDICETVRARWHSLVVLNKAMDGAIRRLSQLAGEPIDRVKEVRDLRMMLANAMEDPSMYIVAGDALSQILDDLTRIFRLDDLRDALIPKMDLIDAVYRDARELNWMRDRGRIKGVDLPAPPDA